MALNIDIIVQDPSWEADISDALFAQAGAALMDVLALDGSYELALLLCDDDEIMGLNGAFRDKQAATNVLSWPERDLSASEPGARPLPPDTQAFPGDDFLGDIAMAYGVCRREATEGGIGFDAHISHLFIHGVLHLLGYDHILDIDARIMEDMERRALAKLGIADPY